MEILLMVAILSLAALGLNAVVEYRKHKRAESNRARLLLIAGLIQKGTAKND